MKKYGHRHGKFIGILFLLAIISLISGCASVENPDETSADSVVTSEVDTSSSDLPAERSDEKTSGVGESVSGTPTADAEPSVAPREVGEESIASLSAEAPAGSRGSDSGGSDGPSFVSSDSSGESGLSAGFADDNQQYGYFVDFLDEYRWSNHIELDISERIILELKDVKGESIPNAKVSISTQSGDSGEIVEVGRTLADGSYQFNPSLYSSSVATYNAAIAGSAGEMSVDLSRTGERIVELSFQNDRVLPSSVPVDIVFVLDTTGSMGEEIDRLKRTIELIHLNLTSMTVPTSLRFGLVLYKDVGDEYRTKSVALTANLQEFQKSLNEVRATGGGDTPEDLQAALEEAIESFDWNEDGIRMSFIITDAPPHLNYGQTYDYTVAARNARMRGIKVFSVGTGGLDLDGEYVLRQIAQFTGGVYIFLTYGESGESSGGAPGSVSHHTGSNFQTDKLESIIIRLAKEELSYLTDAPMTVPDSYFTARKLDTEERERTLALLFDQSVEQLADFSTISISKETAIAVLPISTNIEDVQADAEYFTEQLVLSASRSSRVSLVERRNLQELLEEQKIQLSGLTDSESVTKIGEIMNARILILGVLYVGDSYELFLKLVRVETGEVLSVTKAIIDKELGVSGAGN